MQPGTSGNSCMRCWVSCGGSTAVTSVWPAQPDPPPASAAALPAAFLSPNLLRASNPAQNLLKTSKNSIKIETVSKNPNHTTICCMRSSFATTCNLYKKLQTYMIFEKELLERVGPRKSPPKREPREMVAHSLADRFDVVPIHPCSTFPEKNCTQAKSRRGK